MDDILYRVYRFNPDHRKLYDIVMMDLKRYWDIRNFLVYAGKWIQIGYFVENIIQAE
jgi:hypothetical protein